LSIIIGFFAGLSGSHLLQNNFELLTIAVLGIAGILLCLGGAAGTLLNWSKVDPARSARAKKNVPRITSEWDYQPGKAIRAYAAVDSARADTVDVLSPASFAVNNGAWFNDDSLECTAHPFIKLDATTKAPLSGHASAVSAYD